MRPIRGDGTNIEERDSYMEMEGGNNKYTWWLCGLVLTIFALLGFAVYKAGWLDVFCSEECLLDFINSMGPWGFVGFVLLQSAQVVFAPIPGELTGIVGGYLFGVPLGILLSTIGLTLGSFIAFMISRTLGRPFVEKVVNKNLLAKFDYLLHHKGLFLAFMLFLLPGFPKDYLCFILGLGRLTIVEFLLVSGVGRLFGTTLLTLGGGYLRHGQYDRLIVLTAVSVLLTLVAYVYRKKIERLLNSLLAR